MARKKLDRKLEGEIFGRLTVIAPAPRSDKGYPRWFCRCVCGKERTVYQNNLLYRLSQSCGCLQRDRVAESNRRRKKVNGKELNATIQER